jgi:Flp pilus assembly protein TadG
MRMRRHRRGSAILEFVLTGIPLMFVWISIVQLSLEMWHYHTLQYAVKAAGAYVAHKGSAYVSAGNTAKTISDAAAVLRDSAIGMPTTSLQVTWTSGATSVTCYLNNCLTNTTTWPPTATSSAGSTFTIKADYVFNAGAIRMVTGKYAPVRFGSHHMPGYTRQAILF